MVLWHLWSGSARHAGPGPAPFLIEVLNVGWWLTHCDFALDAEVDFLAVVERRLIPARVTSEWAGLRSKKLASIWAPASKDASHVGYAGVGVVSLSGASLWLPSIDTVQFQRFFFFTVVGLLVACFLWVVVGLCIWLFFMAIGG